MTISTSGVYARARASGSRIVLFVDDYVDSCLIYTEAMFALGAALEMAHDGVEGIAKAKAVLPDAIVMDLSLPGIDGIEVTRRLKADPETRHIPIVALTGLCLSGAEVRAREAGCCAVLQKPCLPETIAGVLAPLLGLSPLADRAAVVARAPEWR
jgi:two-component system cell cycle response regulator DivK